MFYKPNFCAECGEKIERVEWKPWTSRRFCDDCAAPLENAARWKTGMVAIGLIIVGIFAGQIGRFWQKPVAVANVQTLSASSSSNASKSNQTQSITAVNQTASTNPATNALVQTSATPNKTVVSTPPVVAVQTETAYYCGAKTQKGTICTRRVKGGGRCWQHIGKPAMLPQERLIIQSGG